MIYRHILDICAVSSAPSAARCGGLAERSGRKGRACGVLEIRTSRKCFITHEALLGGVDGGDARGQGVDGRTGPSGPGKGQLADSLAIAGVDTGPCGPVMCAGK